MALGDGPDDETGGEQAVGNRDQVTDHEPPLGEGDEPVVEQQLLARRAVGSCSFEAPVGGVVTGSDRAGACLGPVEELRLQTAHLRVATNAIRYRDSPRRRRPSVTRA